jgi:protein-S-isoprenylcysteine O-methyltransferase Ste14
VLSKLQNKIPPPILWGLAALLTFVIDRIDLDGSPLEGATADWVGLLLGVVGVGLGLAGLQRFAKMATTVDPHNIDGASTLVTDGVYRFTRNPMYLGMVLLLIGWSLRLGTLAGLVISSLALIAALTVLQIQPEEEALAHKFGQAYDDYRSKVRRWI